MTQAKSTKKFHLNKKSCNFVSFFFLRKFPRFSKQWKFHQHFRCDDSFSVQGSGSSTCWCCFTWSYSGPSARGRDRNKHLSSWATRFLNDRWCQRKLRKYHLRQGLTSTKNTTKFGFRNRFLVIVEDYDIYPDLSNDAPNAQYVCVAIHGERKKGWKRVKQPI